MNKFEGIAVAAHFFRVSIAQVRFAENDPPDSRLLSLDTLDSIRRDRALSIIACSSRAFNFCGDCLVKNYCLPRASPRSARHQFVISGTVSICCLNCRNVFIFEYFAA